MQICSSVQEIRKLVSGYRTAGDSIGLVTTMGALHDGHMALISSARHGNDRVVATIFVNPSQFGDPSDFEKYPSDNERDIELLKSEGVDVLFMPDVETMYPVGDETIVETTKLANILHGKVRPGHFRGVTTIVARLFNIILPDQAYFGEKDYQQLQVIKRMVSDLHFPLNIISVPTVREEDGLAMSSRNVRLSDEDRKAAIVLSAALDHAELVAKEKTTIESLEKIIRNKINSEPRATLLAVDIVEASSLKAVSGEITTDIAIMISCEFGGILLIDQREIIYEH